MANSEKVTGPGNGLIPLVAVLAMVAATYFGILGLHNKYFISPLDPLGPVEAPAAH